MTYDDHPAESSPSFADLLKSLMRRRLHPEGRPYTVTEVSRALPGDSSYQYLSNVLKGNIKEPGRPTIRALCRFFRVSPAYFFPELSDMAIEPLPPDPLDTADQP